MCGAVLWVWCITYCSCMYRHVLCCVVLCCVMQCNALRCGAVRCGAVRCGVPKALLFNGMAGMPCIWVLQNGRAVCLNARAVCSVLCTRGRGPSPSLAPLGTVTHLGSSGQWDSFSALSL